MIGGVAAAAAVRAFPFRVFSFPSQPTVVSATIGEYADYVNFSQLDFGYRIDPILLRCAEELNYRFYRELDGWMALTDHRFLERA